ncbi:GNAT family N-acetyltransferase [Bifidobacterium vespertilionis]|uniref:GNAT family N-acetyltransferase n=1 Tax=Bifidobacterium vespertilionis TaxID=2562524 RepID=UPI001BDC2A1E|nr:GNAT family N-acetyltransferase [Bifidobacterium vespertilionis]MBT1178249.1 GNAT family N-acetyltransferase [Bifidobacterium vespertilionis]
MAAPDLDIRVYDRAPRAAREIRLEAFTSLADVRPEFDEWDETGPAVHLLAFARPDAVDAEGAVGAVRADGDADAQPVATCRFYADCDHPDQTGRYVIARLAVTPRLQGRGIGGRLLTDAESRIRAAGGRLAAVHADRGMFAYYERRGYERTAEMYDGGTHGWLVKPLG